MLRREAAILDKSLSNKDNKTCWAQLVLCLSLRGFTEPHLLPPPVAAQVLSLLASRKDEGLSQAWDVTRASEWCKLIN